MAAPAPAPAAAAAGSRRKGPTQRDIDLREVVQRMFRLCQLHDLQWEGISLPGTSSTRADHAFAEDDPETRERLKESFKSWCDTIKRRYNEFSKQAARRWLLSLPTIGAMLCPEKLVLLQQQQQQHQQQQPDELDEPIRKRNRAVRDARSGHAASSASDSSVSSPPSPELHGHAGPAGLGTGAAAAAASCHANASASASAAAAALLLPQTLSGFNLRGSVGGGAGGFGSAGGTGSHPGASAAASATLEPTTWQLQMEKLRTELEGPAMYDAIQRILAFRQQHSPPDSVPDVSGTARWAAIWRETKANPGHADHQEALQLDKDRRQCMLALKQFRVLSLATPPQIDFLSFCMERSLPGVHRLRTFLDLMNPMEAQNLIFVKEREGKPYHGPEPTKEYRFLDGLWRAWDQRQQQQLPSLGSPGTAANQLLWNSNISAENGSVADLSPLQPASSEDHLRSPSPHRPAGFNAAAAPFAAFCHTCQAAYNHRELLRCPHCHADNRFAARMEDILYSPPGLLGAAFSQLPFTPPNLVLPHTTAAAASVGTISPAR